MPLQYAFSLKPIKSGQETNWISAAHLFGQGALVALKSDGTLWQRGLIRGQYRVNAPPTRLGIHHDWVALAAVQKGVVTLAADGSLWLWPNRGIMYVPTVCHEAPQTAEISRQRFARIEKLMNVLVKKEIRLLQPVWLAVLVLEVALPWICAPIRRWSLGWRPLLSSLA